jgi:hypothetical protein
MSNHLDLWNRFADIDPAFTKPITGKDYRGTSPNPHYVIQCLTEMFGRLGVGFGWEVEQDEFTLIGEEVLHWCRIRFWHTDRSNGFSAYGQTKALMKTKNGLRLDEDAPKKSLTDAITKAASQIGIAANIFLGRWDDSKYVAEVNAEYRQEERKTDPAAKAVEYINGADSLDDLKHRWKALPDAMRKNRDVIGATNARKAQLKQKEDA